MENEYLKREKNKQNINNENFTYEFEASGMKYHLIRSYRTNDFLIVNLTKDSLEVEFYKAKLNK